MLYHCFAMCHSIPENLQISSKVGILQILRRKGALEAQIIYKENYGLDWIFQRGEGGEGSGGQEKGVEGRGGEGRKGEGTAGQGVGVQGCTCMDILSILVLVSIFNFI